MSDTCSSMENRKTIIQFLAEEGRRIDTPAKGVGDAGTNGKFPPRSSDRPRARPGATTPRIASALLFLLLLLPLFSAFTTLAQTTENFHVRYYDPVGDTQIAAQEGRYVHGNEWKDLDIVEMDLKSETGGGFLPVTTIYMSLTVDGVINDGSEYIYGVYLTVKDTDYFLGYKESGAVGFNMQTGNAVVPRYEGLGTDTITFSVEAKQIGDPSSPFDWNGLTVKRTDTRNYGDMGPNKLVKITEPWDRQTVHGTITVSGEVRDSVLDTEKVEIQLDSTSSGGWEETTDKGGWSSWEHSLDTSKLGAGKHTIYVRTVDGSGTEFKDSIDITVDQDSAVDPSSTDEQPEYSVGDSYRFEISEKAEDEPEVISIDISTRSTMEVKVEEKGVKKEGYDCWRLHSEQTGNLYVGNIKFNFNTDLDQYQEEDDTDIVLEDSTAELTSKFTKDETRHKTTTYSPPKPRYEFPLEVTGRWTDVVAADIELDGDSSTENLDLEGRCLFSENTEVPEDDFETFAVRTQHRDATYYKVDYYAPDIGYPVRIETRDVDDNLIGVLELVDLTIKNTFLRFGKNVTITDREGAEITSGEGKARPGEPLTITLEIGNEGTGTADNALIAGKVKIADPGAEYKEFSNYTFSLKGGGEMTTELSWTPENIGTYELLFLAYSDKDSTGIVDDRLSFDNHGEYVKVYEREETGESFGLFGLSAPYLALVGAAAVMIVVVIVFAKRRSRGEAGTRGGGDVTEVKEKALEGEEAEVEIAEVAEVVEVVAEEAEETEGTAEDVLDEVLRDIEAEEETDEEDDDNVFMSVGD